LKTLLVDLYDTLVWTDWRALGQRLTSRLQVDGAALLRAFEITHEPRGVGRFRGIRGDLAAIVAAARGSYDPAREDQPVPSGNNDPFIAELEAELLDYLRDAAHLYDDVRPVLRALRAARTRVAIVSNCDHVTRPILSNLDLEREVDATVLSCEVKSLKPDAAIFEHALERLGATAAEAVFVDDQARYLDGARALGIETVQIARNPSYGEPSDGGAHRLITGLGDLRALLD
jgi:HAD superfamily hydrolase (TIGR01509 family)